MARPSKTQQFAIYKDPAATTHIPRTPPSLDDDDDEDITETIETSNLLPTDDDSRRQSAVSSLPESSTETDIDYTPPTTRPSFRKPDSVHSIYNRSASRRHAYLPRSRTGTPRSAKGSPLPKKKQIEEVEEKEYPLVLLHVTLLPVELPWSVESLEDILPSYILQNLHLLRSKVSQTILQRGILIPHPQSEYDILEDHLLEALELKKERVTKCGHFRGRGSTSSDDSGVGSSVHDSDDNGEVCLTCRSPVKAAGTGVGTGKNKWSIKVFAANGLMGASAWTAAWSEMERVDVEILPWIGEELRKKLDARMAEEEMEVRRREAEARIRRVGEIVYEGGGDAEGESVVLDDPFVDTPASAPPSNEDWVLDHYATPTEDLREPTSITSDLPPVYARKDIPLSLLLKNYVFLLAQDKKNIAIFGLVVLALWMSLRSALLPAVDISTLPPLQGEPNMSTLMPSHEARGEVLEEVATSVEVAIDYNETDLPQVGDRAEPLEETISEAAESFEAPLFEMAEISGVVDAEEGICENPASRYVLF